MGNQVLHWWSRLPTLPRVVCRSQMNSPTMLISTATQFASTSAPLRLLFQYILKIVEVSFPTTRTSLHRCLCKCKHLSFSLRTGSLISRRSVDPLKLDCMRARYMFSKTFWSASFLSPSLQPSAIVFNTYSLPTTPVTPGSSIVASATPSVSSVKPVEKIGSLNSFDIFEHYYNDDNDSKHNNSPSSGAESPKITSQATTTFLGIFEISDDEVDTSALPRHCPTNFLGVVEISDTEDEDDFIAEVGRSSSASSAAVSRFIDFTKD